MRPGDAVFVPAGVYHCGSDDGTSSCASSVVVSVGLRSEIRSAARLTASLRADSELWRAHHFFTGRRLRLVQRRRKRKRTVSQRDSLISVKP